MDVLRAIAIILVILSHALFFFIQAFPQYSIIKLISYFFGFWGVELFFILSGFLIGKILREQLINQEKNGYLFSGLGDGLELYHLIFYFCLSIYSGITICSLIFPDFYSDILPLPKIWLGNIPVFFLKLGV